MAHAATLIGIVNITEDSFSDGGRFLAADRAIAHARKLLADGADVIELGPASSHPDSKDVSAREEIRRIEPVIDALEGLVLAVDTYRAETQVWCAERGVAMVNDIQAFDDRAAWPALAKADCHLVAMHSVQRRGRATRVATAPETIVDELCSFLERRVADLVIAGVERQRIVADPGMGFFLGRDADVSLEVLRRIPVIKDRLGLPVYISVSRKSFLGELTGRPAAARGAATLAAELFAVQAGASYIRTHAPGALRDALIVMDRLRGPVSPGAT